MADDVVTIEYVFQLNSGDKKRFVVRLRKPTLTLVRSTATSLLPAWTRLAHHQCPNCPLKPDRHPHCPIAANLVEVIESFKDSMSTEPSDITVRTDLREFHKRAPLPAGVSSLMGLFMVASGCPIMDRLRPMAHVHLPFATLEETMYRAASMYLLAQYFVQNQGGKADWRLERLLDIYRQVNDVNRSFSRRLLSINPQDASLNALVNLDCFATVTAFSIVRDSLKDIQTLFQAYLQENQEASVV
jgi:Domain of unknown function (DUF6901)